MITFVQGKLIEKTPTYAVIETSGIGYMIHISLNTYAQIANLEQCLLHTHLSIKEDSHSLYGFFTLEERAFFRLLIAVSGVGANTARLILSSLSPDELTQAILSENVNSIKSVKGIGLKTAQRLIIELKDKIAKGNFSGEKIIISHNRNKDEALSALMMLGFPKNSADMVIDKIQKAEGLDLSVEELVKKSLKML